MSAFEARLSGPFSLPTLTGGFSPRNGGSKHVVDGSNMLDLLCEGAYAFEFALRRSEVKLLVGHRFGSRDEFLLHSAERAIKHRSER